MIAGDVVLRERNLAAYFDGEPETREALRAHVCEGLEVLASRAGPPTLRFRGQLLHSAVDPMGEAARLFADERIRDAKLVVLMGLGLGHTLRALRERSRARVVVYEPSKDILAHALGTLLRRRVDDCR